jgi:hypothetical protein
MTSSSKSCSDAVHAINTGGELSGRGGCSVPRVGVESASSSIPRGRSRIQACGRGAGAIEAVGRYTPVHGAVATGSAIFERSYY